MTSGSRLVCATGETTNKGVERFGLEFSDVKRGGRRVTRRMFGLLFRCERICMRIVRLGEITGPASLGERARETRRDEERETERERDGTAWRRVCCAAPAGPQGSTPGTPSRSEAGQPVSRPRRHKLRAPIPLNRPVLNWNQHSSALIGSVSKSPSESLGERCGPSGGKCALDEWVTAQHLA